MSDSRQNPAPEQHPAKDGLSGGVFVVEEKNKGGRPTKLTEETVAKAEAYVDACRVGQKEIVVRQGLDKDGDTRWEQTAPRLPNIARLAIECGINKTTVFEWMKPKDSDTPEMTDLRRRFSNAYASIGELQESMLVEEGGAGRLNPAVVNRILAAKHNYRDKSDVTTNDEPVRGVVVLPALDGNG